MIAAACWLLVAPTGFVGFVDHFQYDPQNRYDNFWPCWRQTNGLCCPSLAASLDALFQVTFDLRSPLSTVHRHKCKLFNLHSTTSAEFIPSSSILFPTPVRHATPSPSPLLIASETHAPHSPPSSSGSRHEHESQGRGMGAARHRPGPAAKGKSPPLPFIFLSS